MSAITLIWPDGRETDHDPFSLGLEPGSVPPKRMVLFNGTTRVKLLRWNIGQALYLVVEYNHQGVAA